MFDYIPHLASKDHVWNTSAFESSYGLIITLNDYGICEGKIIIYKIILLEYQDNFSIRPSIHILTT